MNHSLILAILILSPLIGFAINGLRFKKNTPVFAGVLASVAVFTSFVASIILMSELVSMPAEGRKLLVHYFEWINIAKFSANVSFVVDQISAIMILIITGVGTLIHLFSMGYMNHDKGVSKYFAYLNFFIFNMLLLVLGDNLLLMFVGWEGVGLCSYLLIGFWFTDREKAAAGMKAFITNRVGDAAFLIGIFILFVTFGTINFSELNALAPTTAEASWLGAVTLGTLFLFIGATGKSAQLPLHIWLPDAMAGPTPVSALIHAATMVTAGIYMIVRLNPLFMAAPNTMMVVATIGAITLLLGALIGLTQWDIKKVLAYSTISQLGYMFLAVGVGAFGAAMFHLMTHAFFKALMFLGAGSVIHAMNGEQDIRKMGALKKFLPITHFTFVIGWLAIIGMPPFSGFFSKDEILAYSFNSSMGSPFLWAIGVLGATLTAFYMTRLMALTFWGQSRVSPAVKPHESPMIMTMPLVFLGVLAAVAGWVGVPHALGNIFGHLPNFWETWLSPVMTKIPNWTTPEASVEFTLMGVSVGFALVSAIVAFKVYEKNPEGPKNFVNSIKPVYNFIDSKFYVDEFYGMAIVRPLVQGSKNLWRYVELLVIDGFTRALANLATGLGSVVRSLQTGNMQQYAMYIGIGIVVILSYVITR